MYHKLWSTIYPGYYKIVLKSLDGFKNIISWKCLLNVCKFHNATKLSETYDNWWAFAVLTAGEKVWRLMIIDRGLHHTVFSDLQCSAQTENWSWITPRKLILPVVLFPSTFENGVSTSKRRGCVLTCVAYICYKLSSAIVAVYLLQAQSRPKGPQARNRGPTSPQTSIYILSHLLGTSTALLVWLLHLFVCCLS